MGEWTFFSNHGHVLVCLARESDVRLRDVASQVGITERAVQKIVRDLQDAGYLTVTKQGRCNRYRINKRRSLRHDIVSHCTVGKLLALLARRPRRDPEPVSEPAAPAKTAEKRDQQAPVTTGVEKPAEPPARVADPKPSKEEKSKTKPVDVRQQGSLF